MTIDLPQTSPSQSNTDEQAFLLHILSQIHATCPSCAADLFQATEANCPNCKSAIALSLGLINLNLKPWISLLIVLCTTGGIGVLIIIVISYNGLPMPWFDWIDVAALYIAANGPLAIFSIIFRRRIIRLPRPVQWALAAGAAALTTCAFLTFYYHG